MADHKTIANQILDFMAFSERLKFELRHSWISSGRQESVAEHSWQMALMALLSYQHLAEKIDIAHVLKMIIVHDLVEAEAGDVPYMDQVKDPSIRELKIQREKEAMEKIRSMLPDVTGEEIYKIWYEYEDRHTPEAKFASALDDLEVQVQHNLASFETWEESEIGFTFSKTHRRCGYDPFLTTLADTIVERTEDKLSACGVDVEFYRKKAVA